jgi:hypothetical protein
MKANKDSISRFQNPSIIFSTFNKFSCAILLVITLVACGGGDGNKPAVNTSVSGTIYFIFAGEMHKFDIATGKNTKLSGQGTFDAGFLDVSADGQELLYVRDAPGSDGGDWYDQEYFNLVNSNDFSQVNSRFKKFSSTETRTIFAKLSPDKSKIAVIYKYYEGAAGNGAYVTNVRVWDRNGALISAFTKDNSGNRVKEFAWLPDGNLLMTTDLGIVKTTNTSLQNFDLLFKPDLPSWRSVVASPDGKRLALKSGKHIYTMNIDGSNLVQLTDSDGDDQEFSPIWSPDGKYIAFTTSIFTFSTGPIVSGGGTIYQMILAPADNKSYNLNRQYLETLNSGGLTGTSTIVANNGLILLKTDTNSNIFSQEDFIWRY